MMVGFVLFLIVLVPDKNIMENITENISDFMAF